MEALSKIHLKIKVQAVEMRLWHLAQVPTPAGIGRRTASDTTMPHRIGY